MSETVVVTIEQTLVERLQDDNTVLLSLPGEAAVVIEVDELEVIILDPPPYGG